MSVKGLGFVGAEKGQTAKAASPSCQAPPFQNHTATMLP